MFFLTEGVVTRMTFLAIVAGAVFFHYSVGKQKTVNSKNKDIKETNQENRQSTDTTWHI
jgi:hypothetical protein